jgi:hypothetical protein
MGGGQQPAEEMGGGGNVGNGGGTWPSTIQTSPNNPTQQITEGNDILNAEYQRNNHPKTFITFY